LSYKKVVYGKDRVRRDYARIQTNVEMPNLIEIQTKSFEWFLNEGLKELFEEISPVTSQNEKLELQFGEYRFGEAKVSVQEAKRNKANYTKPLEVDFSLVFYEDEPNPETGEKEVSRIANQSLFFGEFPVMTPSGTFIINGSERVIITQVIRSAGVYFAKEVEKKTGAVLYSGQIIPTRGAWIEFETGKRDIWYVKFDRSNKLPLTTFLRALGLNSNRDIINLFGMSEHLQNTFVKDTSFGSDDALRELYDKLRQGETATTDAARKYIASRIFENKRYDLASVGRYKVNQKLDVFERLTAFGLNKVLLDQNIYREVDGKEELLYERGTELNKEIVSFLKENRELIRRTFEYEIMLEGDSVTLEVLDLEIEIDGEMQKIRVLGNDQSETKNRITLSDIFASISYFMGLNIGLGKVDDIDHLGNRRLRPIGELLQNQARQGLMKLEKSIVSKMSTAKEFKTLVPDDLINGKTLLTTIQTFFATDQLSQFMDQVNPLSELTNKRRISALGSGGLTRERAGFEVRDVHTSHYGRICPIETPEGQNIGLISSLATYSKVDKYGFIQTPYFKVHQIGDKTYVSNDYRYYKADEEEKYYITQANVEMHKTIYQEKDLIKIDDRYFINIEGKEIGVFEAEEAGKPEYYTLDIVSKEVVARYRGENIEIAREMIELMDVSPKQIVSVSAALIPFLEHDDANRALMGANMQRQAVPLLKPEAPIVATGIETQAAHDGGSAIVSTVNGTVEYVDSNVVIIRDEDKKTETYELLKFERSNDGTCINQKAIVEVGEKVKKGDVIADGLSMDRGELALGRNVVIAFTTWHGYNFEDAVIMSERLVQDDVYTSIHISVYEVDVCNTKLGAEYVTRDLDNEKKSAIANLDEEGIVRIGAKVGAKDVLVGKVSPKGQTVLSPEEKLSQALFSDRSKDVKNTSLRVPHGGGGIVLKVERLKRSDGHELKTGVNETIKVYVVQKRKIGIGDKMSGRHGNKGVISLILPEEDMPYLEDGTPVDILLNPQGIPSRLNIGQVLEVHLGMAAKKLGLNIATQVFDGVTNEDLQKIMEEAEMSPDGKTTLYDGQTGEPFDNPVAVGVMYMIKLNHMVDDKIHARSEGPYSLVTQQSMGGKAQNGGQRFGEMEVWALEAYGAAYTLQEMLTIKSDDMIGRNKVYKAIVDGKPIPEPGVPESFRVLIKELQALCLDVDLIDAKTKENVANKSIIAEAEEARKSVKDLV